MKLKDLAPVIAGSTNVMLSDYGHRIQTTGDGLKYLEDKFKEYEVYRLSVMKMKNGSYQLVILLKSYVVIVRGTNKTYDEACYGIKDKDNISSTSSIYELFKLPLFYNLTEAKELYKWFRTRGLDSSIIEMTFNSEVDDIDKTCKYEFKEVVSERKSALLKELPVSAFSTVNKINDNQITINDNVFVIRHNMVQHQNSIEILTNKGDYADIEDIKDIGDLMVIDFNNKELFDKYVDKQIGVFYYFMKYVDDTCDNIKSYIQDIITESMETCKYV